MLSKPFLEPQAVFVWYLSYIINLVELVEYDALIPLDPNKASVIDDISFKIIQSCTEVLFRPFHHLFTISLRYGLIPTGWKVCTIVSVLNRCMVVLNSGDQQGKLWLPQFSHLQQPH